MLHIHINDEIIEPVAEVIGLINCVRKLFRYNKLMSLGETSTVNAFLSIAARWKMYRIYGGDMRRHSSSIYWANTRLFFVC